MAKIKLNGKNISILKDTSLLSLLEKYKIDKKKIAIELNGKIVQKNRFQKTFLKNLDRVELVHFIGGG
jgi:sulfur carrier protein